MGSGASAGTSEGKDVGNTTSAGTTKKTGGNKKSKRPPRKYLFKLLVIGDAGVGKSSLQLQFTDRTFTQEYKSTIGLEFSMRTIKLDEDTVDLQLWDTAGQERFQTLGLGYYRGARGVLVLYDVTNQQSFNNIKQWLDDVERYTGELVSKVLVGNKCDLAADKVIDYTTAKEYADDLGIPFIETSAKDFINVDEAFITLAAAVKNMEDSQGSKIVRL